MHSQVPFRSISFIFFLLFHSCKLCTISSATHTFSYEWVALIGNYLMHFSYPFTEFYLSKWKTNKINDWILTTSICSVSCCWWKQKVTELVNINFIPVQLWLMFALRKSHHRKANKKFNSHDQKPCQCYKHSISTFTNIIL